MVQAEVMETSKELVWAPGLEEVDEPEGEAPDELLKDIATQEDVTTDVTADYDLGEPDKKEFAAEEGDEAEAEDPGDGHL